MSTTTRNTILAGGLFKCPPLLAGRKSGLVMRMLGRLAVLAVLVPAIAQAAGGPVIDCPDDNYTLTTQAQVDAFPASCTVITGSLLIVNSRDIADLSPLSAITTVEGSLEIRGNAALVYTDGLANLYVVGGQIRISDNPFLFDIWALWNLTSVNGLYIENNPRLDKLDGAYHVTESRGDLVVAGNNTLLHLYGFSNFQSVSGNLRVQQNGHMINVDGLYNVKSVGGSLTIVGNPKLASCGAGLFSLVKTGGVAGGVAMNGNAGNSDCNNNGANLKPAANIKFSTPRPTSPPNGANAQITPFIELLWNRIEGAERYNTQVSLDYAFTKVVTPDNVPNVRSKFYDASVGKRYFWRVQALGQGVTTDWSQIWSFVAALSKPEAVTLIDPENSIAGVAVNPVFKWVDVDSTFTYQLQVSADPSFTNLVVNETGLRSGWDSLETSLAYETNYSWRVRARNASGDGPWSTGRSFRTTVAAPDAVTLELPEDGAVDVSTIPTLSWNSVELADAYHLQLASDSEFTAIVVDDSVIAGLAITLDSPLPYETTIYWRVRGGRDDGLGKAAGMLYGPWSETRSFATEAGAPDAVALSWPEDGAVGIPPYTILSWWPVSDISGYHLQIATDSAFERLVTEDSMIAETSITLDHPLAYNTRFFWRVQAGRVDESGKSAEILYGPWSLSRSFTVAIGTKSDGDGPIPAELALEPNYPNPFDASTTIWYSLPEATDVRVTIFDPLGRPIEVLVSNRESAGRHVVVWNAKSVPSGEYFVTLKAGGRWQSKRMLVAH